MLNWLREMLFLFVVTIAMKGGAKLMSEKQLQVFATTYVALILAGRRTLDDVPAVLLDMVKADLGIID